MNWKLCYTIFWIEVFLSHTLRAGELNTAEVKSSTNTPFLALRYDLDIYTYILEKEPYYRGRVRIVFQCEPTTKTKQIELNASYLDINKMNVEVNLLDDNGVSKNSMAIHTRSKFVVLRKLSIIMENYFIAGNLYEVIVEFSKSLLLSRTSDQLGYILRKYTIEWSYVQNKPTFIPQGSNKLMAQVQLDDFSISRVFPCFDEIDNKAAFKVRSFHHKNFVGFSSGNLKSTKAYDDIPDWVVDEFDETIRLAPFSISIAVMDLSKIELTDTSSNVVVRVWADGRLISEMRYMNKISLSSFQYFSNYFGNTPKLKKLDVIIHPIDEEEYYGFYGIITIRQAAVLYSAYNHNTYDHFVSVHGLCRKMSKQWIGHTVTLSYRREFWLHHGLNLFLQRLCAIETYPKWEVGMMLEDIACSFTSLLRWQPEKSLKQFWNFNYDIHSTDEEFQKHFFWKVEYIFRMIHFALGSTLFQLCLTNYVTIFQFTNPNSKEIWGIFSKTAQEAEMLPHAVSLEKVAELSLIQTRYPVIFAEYYSDSNLISLRQEPYKHLEEENEIFNPYWIIPIKFTTKSKVNFEEDISSTWLDTEEPIVKDLVIDPGHWYLLNLQLNVLAYVHYDKENWVLIQEQLLSEHMSIDPISRVRLVIDMFALADSGILLYDFVFETMKYLKREKSYPTWKVALEHFEKIQIRLFGTHLLTPYEKYIKSILKPVYEELPFKNLNQFYADDHIQHIFEISIIEASYKFGSTSCRDDIKTYIKKKKSAFPQGDFVVPNRIFELNLCDELKNDSTFKKCMSSLETVRRSKLENGKEEVLKALTCCNNLDFAREYLDWTFGAIDEEGTSLTPEERLWVLRNMSRNLNDKIKKLVREYFMGSYKFIEDTYGLEELVSISMCVFEITTKQKDLDQLIEFLKLNTSNKDVTDTSMKMFEKGINIARRNILWIERNKRTLKDYFKKNKFKRSFWNL